MPDKDNVNMELDWREQGQEKYLNGLTFSKQKYTKYSDSWEHDHCEFCGSKFCEKSISSCNNKSLHEGYATEDKYRWICENCFNDFEKKYNLKESQR